MATSAIPLLSAEDRAEILRMFTEMKAGYATLTTAIAESKPTGEIKLKLEKIDESLLDFQTKHAAVNAKLEGIEQKINQRKQEMELPKSIGDQVIENPAFLAAVKSGGRLQITIPVKGP